MKRIDVEIVNRNILLSRSKAQAEIKSGHIYCNGTKVIKPSFMVNDSDIIELKGECLKYVSRGGLKLEKAINDFGINLNNKVMLDIGSSTGGFSDCALQNGIKKIYDIDVGTDQLDPKIRNNSRVIVYEKTDFRQIDIDKIIDSEICTIDVSFISVTKLIDKMSELKLSEIICLIKPQFECGLEVANKYKGIPLNKEVHNTVIKKVIKSFDSIGYKLCGLTFSPITGGNGNIEYLSYFAKECNARDVNISKVIDESFKKLGKSAKNA